MLPHVAFDGIFYYQSAAENLRRHVADMRVLTGPEMRWAGDMAKLPGCLETTNLLPEQGSCYRSHQGFGWCQA